MSVILGIETSCDETAAAVVRDGRVTLSNVIASQHDLHREYGGVVPEIASRAHLERIIPVLRAATSRAGVALADLDAVAVGNRPGLIGSLLVGVAAAKGLAWALGRPIIGVDHVRAHLYSAFLRDPASTPADTGRAPTGNALAGVSDVADAYPALGLVISGGHTATYACDAPTRCVRLGTTIDDAVGEAYDKAASLLGLPHPGGPHLDRLAQSGDDRAIDLPVARLAPDSLDFSFSGLKTAVRYRVRPPAGAPADAVATLTEQARADLAASFQRAACRAVLLKLERALAVMDRRPRSLLVGGGVSANSRLRRELLAFASTHGLTPGLPSMHFCLDNAAMIAGLAHHRLRTGDVDTLSLSARPTLALDEP